MCNTKKNAGRGHVSVFGLKKIDTLPCIDHILKTIVWTLKYLMD